MSDSKYFNKSRHIDEQNSLNLKKILSTIFLFWPRFIGSIILCLIVAFLYLRYTSPIYNIHAKLLILDDKSPGNIESNLFQNMGLVSKRRSVDNEIEVLKSYSLMEKVVRELNLNTKYFTCGKIKSLELYTRRPFSFTFFSTDTTRPFYGNFKVKCNGSNYIFDVYNKQYTAKWGDTIFLSNAKIILTNPINNNLVNQEFEVQVNNINSVVNEYMSTFTVSTPSKIVSALTLNIRDVLPEKGEIVLNKLIEIYLKTDIEDKNKIADNTITFIEDRLNYVGNELSGVENRVEGFKKVNINYVGSKPNLLLNDAHDIDYNISAQKIQVVMIESLESYLNNAANKQKPLPSASLIQQDPNIGNIIIKYNDLKLNRDKLLFFNTEDNPAVKNIDLQLDNLRQELKNSLAALKRNLITSINALQNESGKLKQEIQTVPGKERVFTDISRQQITKQELFLFLLKKREETAITKSSTIADARIIDYAQHESLPISPNRSQIFLTAFLMGIIIPSISVYLQWLFNNRVMQKADILNATSTPILGEIGHNDKDDQIVIQAGSRSLMAEQFRSLRTNLQFAIPNKEQRTILLTSSMSGEGKSFIAVNLSITLALADKKVLLIEFDLRKPRISKLLGLENILGFSNYVAGQANLSDIILPSGLNENFFVIAGGHVPPNPTELILMPKVDEMFETLKMQFDCIVVDTAPIGLVSDAQLLSKYADATLFIVRQGYTFKQQLEFIEEVYTEKKLPSFNLIINDIKNTKGMQYGYAYAGNKGFSYNYGAVNAYTSDDWYTNNTYFEDKKKQINWTNFISRFKSNKKV